MDSPKTSKPDSRPSNVTKKESDGSAKDATTQEATLDPEKQEERAMISVAQAKKYPETDLSQGIVGWDSQDDPANPQNFATSKKWALLALISAFTFISPLASSMFSPAVVFMAAEFHETNETILAFSVSIYLVGYVVSDI